MYYIFKCGLHYIAIFKLFFERIIVFQKYLENLNLKIFIKCDNLNSVVGRCQDTLRDCESCLHISPLKSL